MLQFHVDMKLLFDARYIRTNHHDGISRFSAELAASLFRITPVVFLIHDVNQLTKLPDNCDYLIIHKPTSIKEPLTSLILNRYKPDVVFSPMQTMGSFGRRFKLILTLHDMIYYKFRTPPKYFNPIIRFGWWLYHLTYVPQRITLNSADMVATVSETSKQSILGAKLTKRQVIVIPNAPQDLTDQLTVPLSNKHEPINIVYMGSFLEYKNVETLIKATKYLKNHTLHLLSGITPNRMTELDSLRPKGAKVVFHNGVTDQEYANILADRSVLVMASRDEGYGLPVAEALAMGVPAVVSDIPIFHEVAGDGALYFNPDSAQDLANKIKSLSDDKLRQNLIKQGSKHISQYDWDKSARKLLSAIKSSLLQ